MSDRKLLILVSAVMLLLVCAVGVQTYQIIRLNERLAERGEMVVASAPPSAATPLDIALTPTPTPGPALDPPTALPEQDDESDTVADAGSDLRVAPPEDNDGSFATPAPNQQAQLPSMPAFPDPFQRMRQMDRMIQAMMDDAFGPWHQPGITSGFMMNHSPFAARGTMFNLQEEPDRYILSADIPDLKDNSVNVKVQNNRLHISADQETTSEVKDPSGRVIQRSSSISSFRQNLQLPPDARGDLAEPRYEDGKLTITVPKK